MNLNMKQKTNTVIFKSFLACFHDDFYLLLFRVLVISLIILLSAKEIYSQSVNSDLYPLSISENYRIHPGSTTQTEVFITTSPVDENIVFSSCNTLTFIPLFVSEGIFVSTNGGTSWTGNDSCTGEPVNFHGGDPGIAIDKDGRFIITRLSNSFPGLFSHFSYDNGQTWTSQSVISLLDSERASVISDGVSTSNHYGRTYASWVGKTQPPYPVLFTFVDNGNEQWSDPVPINSPDKRSAGGDIATGPGGEVYVCWAGVTDVSPFREIYVGFAKSGDGGTNWSVTEQAFDINGINGILTDKSNIRVNGLPGIAIDKTNGVRNGWIYIVTGQKDLAPAGSDPDIILYRSSDNGNSWSDGIRVNQDQVNNGKTQYFPAIHIDNTGAVVVIYYDDRNTATDSTGVFLSRSKDGGNTWQDYEISDHNFKPEPIGALGQGYQGDNIDITSTNESLLPVWMDNSTGNYQIWTSKIDIKTIDDLPVEKASMVKLEQNFPNPMISSSIIRYSINKHEYVSIKFYDINGNYLFSRVNKMKQPGEHSIVVNGSEFYNNSGLYYYQIKSESTTKTKKLILLD